MAASRAAPLHEVVRAQVLVGYVEGASISGLQRQIGLKDTCHRPHEPEITDEAKAWVVGSACTKPRDHGLARELWSISALARQRR